MDGRLCMPTKVQISNKTMTNSYVDFKKNMNIQEKKINNFKYQLKNLLKQVYIHLQ